MLPAAEALILAGVGRSRGGFADCSSSTAQYRHHSTGIRHRNVLDFSNFRQQAVVQRLQPRSL